MDDFRKPSNNGVLPDAAELMDGGEARDDSVVLDGDMAGEAAVVREDIVIPHLAVMSDVGVAEEKIVRADAGGQFLVGAAVDGTVFAKSVVIAHFQCGWFANVFEILGFPSDDSEGKELVSFSESRGALDDYVGVEHAFVAQGDICTDGAIGADPNVFSEFGLRGNDGGGVNHSAIVSRRCGGDESILSQCGWRIELVCEKTAEAAGIGDGDRPATDLDFAGIAEFGEDAGKRLLPGAQLGGEGAFGNGEADYRRGRAVLTTVDKPVEEACFRIAELVVLNGGDEFLKVAAEGGEHA